MKERKIKKKEGKGVKRTLFKSQPRELWAGVHIRGQINDCVSLTCP